MRKSLNQNVEILFTILGDMISNQRPTKCPCRNVTHIQKVYKDQPITEFAFKFPIKNVSNVSNLSAPRKMFPRKKRTIPTHDTLFKTRLMTSVNSMIEVENDLINNSLLI